jgi:hypothetical protein
MVRRWRLIGYFPILYNPPVEMVLQVWGFAHDRVRGAAWNIFDDNGVIAKEKIKPPTWPRPAPGAPESNWFGRRRILRRSLL